MAIANRIITSTTVATSRTLSPIQSGLQARWTSKDGVNALVNASLDQNLTLSSAVKPNFKQLVILREPLPLTVGDSVTVKAQLIGKAELIAPNNTSPTERTAFIEKYLSVVNSAEFKDVFVNGTVPL